MLQLAAAAYQAASKQRYYISSFILAGNLDSKPFRDDASVEYTYAEPPASDGTQPERRLTVSRSGSSWSGYDRLDQYGQPIPTGAVVWNATGGNIDDDGVFIAGQDEGSFYATATAGALKARSAVIVGDQPPPPPNPPAQPGSLHWTGDVPPQKWMNFYTKVLSKFAGGKGLRLTLSVEVSPEGGISPQKVEETKTALQELGLNSNIEIS